MCGVRNKYELSIKFNGFNKILACVTPSCTSSLTDIVSFYAIVNYITTQEQAVVYMYLYPIEFIMAF